ncbi:1-phosphofructokinase family hexose kinase [Amycolatopsis cihanbeyliensis]|uniref:Fructose-1-phosphate kinase n=1 Tax=Amycolatopsis cihanbeyliensis TaxID=1128664 RepID=A0A542CS63_AMYCI|nr:1-phosphofructokinase family hexose kinase [Amycolatopsis cihanbeyliensis]TQI93664.1 fructose-1-phosphate kinase [Amycolatopsis cihanbeyliensis]
MIVTVTLNPSVDRTVEVGGFRRGTLLRATGGQVEAGGKGINVTKALSANRVDSVAVLPVGGAEGRHLGDLLAVDGVPAVLVPVGPPTRSNVSVVEPDGTVTKVNERGGGLSEAELGAIRDAVVEQVPGAAWVVLAGSLPADVPDSSYGEAVRRLREVGVPVAVDTSGSALVEAIKNGPDLAKPNLTELESVVGRRLTTLGAVAEAARLLQGAGVDTVLASLGSDGAVLVEREGRVWHGEAGTARCSAVGAGDALLAGFLAAGAVGPDALGEALRWAAAAVSLPGSGMPGPDDIQRVQVRVRPDFAPERRLVDRD